MERHFDEELNDLKKKVLKIQSLVETAIMQSVKALVERDSELAEKVIENDQEIDLLEIMIDRQCLELLAKRQPMAVDLRFITSIQKINNDLERIGDLAINVAYASKYLSKHPPLKPMIIIPAMAEETRQMLKDAMLSFVDENSALAREICKKDSQIDELYVQNFREILTYMMEDTNNIKRGIRLILVSKHIERMADHITNIAEDIVYMIDGKTIKHHFEDENGREKKVKTDEEAD
ncbi:MAG: phosphate signaling complex protein PhoU [Candidatus Goldbacteria bacterium]|nr:phosphate signaling complex protein PhoU [Candidatus Goldiibacteriota bacterium]